MVELPEWDYHKYLTDSEAREVLQQFFNGVPDITKIVFWAGMARESVQRWADANGMYTLTRAMGPLMLANSPVCRKSRMSKKAWRKYIKGASALFAVFASQSPTVKVIMFPPYDCAALRPNSTFRRIEKPILSGCYENGSRVTIEYLPADSANLRKLCQHSLLVKDKQTA